MDRSSRQKRNRETLDLNCSLDHTDLKDIYRTFHPAVVKYTFFPSTHGTFFRIDCTLGHRKSLNKFEKVEIISSIFSDHSM